MSYNAAIRSALCAGEEVAVVGAGILRASRTFLAETAPLTCSDGLRVETMSRYPSADEGQSKNRNQERRDSRSAVREGRTSECDAAV